MMFLFAGHSAGLLSKNFVKQRLHENFRIPAPWLTKEIIFVCTVFLFLYTVNALWEDAYTCPIYAVNRTTESAIHVMELAVMGWTPMKEWQKSIYILKVN